MGLIDVLVILAVTNAAFLSGFFLRGWLGGDSADESWPLAAQRIQRYDPPRLDKRL